jgi:hypothetical protein
MQKRMILPAMALVVSAGLLYNGTRASAFQPGTVRGTLISRLAERFERSEAEVAAVFEEVRAEKQQGMRGRLEDRLNVAVQAGELSVEQKELILQKTAELRAQRQADHEAQQWFSPEERRAELQAARDELEAWAEEHAIDLQYFGGSGMKGLSGRGMKAGLL